MKYHYKQIDNSWVIVRTDTNETVEILDSYDRVEQRLTTLNQEVKNSLGLKSLLQG